jgi:hypothetical protein
MFLKQLTSNNVLFMPLHSYCSFSNKNVTSKLSLHKYIHYKPTQRILFVARVTAQEYREAEHELSFFKETILLVLL